MKTLQHVLTAGKNILAVGCILLVLGACSGMPTAGSAMWGDLGSPTDQVPFMEQVRTGTLPSGLRYFILENAMPENRAFLTLAVKAGSVLEEEHERGLAHFTEHMAFNGTERFPEAELVNYLRSLGMRFGPEINAYTYFDQTVYGIEVPVETGDDGIRRIPDTALAVIDDWTRAVTFNPKDVDEERPVIMEEYRIYKGASDRIQQQWLPVLFRGSPYAERTVLGLPEIIQGAPAADLENFYKKWYQADNMALILVGNFDGAALEASLGDHFLIQKPAVPTQPPVYDLPPPQKGTIETLIVTDPELTETRIELHFKREPEARRGDLAFYRGEIIDVLIDRMLNFRFETKQLNPVTPCMYMGAGTSRFGQASRFFLMVTRAKTGRAEEALTELLKAKESMLRYGFTDTELSIAGRSILSELQQLVLEKDRRQSDRYIDSLTYYYLNGGNLADFEWELHAVQELLLRITVKDINKVIKDYFRNDDLRVLIAAPDAERNSLPDEARVRQMVKDSRKLKITKPQLDAEEDAALVLFVPEKGAVTAESVDPETGAVIWELSNGAKVILQSTANKNDEIIVQAMARGGTSSAAPEDVISARLAVEMAQVSGLGRWPLSVVTQKLADKQVSLSFWSALITRGVQGSAVSGDLQSLFEMLYLGFTDPRIDPVAAESLLDQYRSSLALRNEDPWTVFADEIHSTLNGGNPHMKPLQAEDLPKAEISTALTYIRKGLNPADYTFVFTGNLTPEMMKNYIETYIASIPTGENWNTWTDVAITRPGKVEKIVRKGKEDQCSTYMAWFSKIPFSNETIITANVLSAYLDIVMTEEIREKLGGVYSISVEVSSILMPKDEAAMLIYFACDPKRLQELSAAVVNLLNQTAGAGINRDTFGKAVESLKKNWETSMQSNSYIAEHYLSSLLLLEEPLSSIYHLPEYCDAVTPEDIQQMCAQLLQNGPAQVVLMPE